MNNDSQVIHIPDHVWEKIEPFTIGNRGCRGGNAEDTRIFIEGVFWVLRTKEPWRKLPNEYGNWNTVHRRFIRWRTVGVWEKILEVLIDYKEFDWLFLGVQRKMTCDAPWMRMVCRSETLLKMAQNYRKNS